ncbi:unnamed protein product, partial [Rhizoctonia solani]
MHSSFFFALLTTSFCSVLAGPAGGHVPITKRAGPVKPNSYIIAYTYDRAFQGYAAQLEGKALEYVRQSKDVEYIVQDEQVKLPDISTAGIQASSRSSTYEHSTLSKRVNGTGVDIYQIATPFDNAVTNAINAGIHVVVAAGDQNVDASTISPARVAAAVTVGAVAANGSKLSTSNFGSVVDVWGPGKNVPVAWISSPTAVVNLVGMTASAASNVAGILAVAIDNHGNKSPAALQADLKSNAQTANGLLVPKI